MRICSVALIKVLSRRLFLDMSCRIYGLLWTLIVIGDTYRTRSFTPMISISWVSVTPIHMKISFEGIRYMHYDLFTYLN